jgi:lipoprotein-anchoring transpeptidase ErfK/SrfK
MGALVVFMFPAGSLGSMRPDRQSTTGGEALPHLVIESAKHTLTLTVPGQPAVSMKAHGAYALTKGSFTVQQKVNDPIWKAPPTYFLRRGLEVPERGSPAHYVKGALGRQALFINDQVAIHNSLIWSDEVGGVRLNNEDMARLFETVKVGATIEVR